MPPQSYTPHGLGTYAEFTDTYGAQVTVRQSSAAEHDCVWIFANGGGTVMRGDDRDTSPHLNVEQARQVRDALTEWLRDVGAEAVQ